MGLISRAIIFAAKEVVAAASGEIGNHVGDAIGTLLGRKIDPEHAKKDDKDKDDKHDHKHVEHDEPDKDEPDEGEEDDDAGAV